MGRYRNVSILAAAIFIQIVGLAVQVKRRAENQSTRLIRVWTIGAITPLEKTIVSLQTGTSEIWHNYIYLRGVRQQNRRLEGQIQQLQLEEVRLRQDAEQARRLQALLGFKEQFVDKTTAAQVIGSSGSEQSRIVYLDKGSADGIAQDMAVISPQGVVGKVIQIFRHTSQVLLINDQTSGVGTILEQSRLQGVLKGRPTGELVLDKIMAEEEVKTGDRVLTSGGDQIFPKGLTIGTVSNVSRAGEFLLVKIQPAASLNHLEEVLVITKKQEREPEVASGTPVRAADILAQRLPSVPDTPPTAAGTAANSGVIGSKPVSETGGLAKPSNNSAQPVVQRKVQPSEAPAGSAQTGAAPGALTPNGTPTPASPGGQTQPQVGNVANTRLVPTAVPLKTANANAAPPKSALATGDSASGKTATVVSQPPAAKPANAQTSKPANPQTSKPVANTTPAHPSATGDVPQ